MVDVLFQEVPCPADDVLSSQNGSGAVWKTWEAYAGKSIQDFTANRPFASSGSVVANVESSACGDSSIESAAAPAPSAAPSAPGPVDRTGNRTGEIPPRRGAFSVRGTAEATGIT